MDRGSRHPNDLREGGKEIEPGPWGMTSSVNVCLQSGSITVISGARPQIGYHENTMTLFEGLLGAVLSALTTFLPLGGDAHFKLLSTLTGWSDYDPKLFAWWSMAAWFALVIHFRHDLASMGSGFISMILSRKAPRTLDERIPLFVLLIWAPQFAAHFGLQFWSIELGSQPSFYALGLIAGGIALLTAERLTRRQKNFWDWTWFDAFIIGIISSVSVLPGLGWMTTVLAVGYFRNFRIEGIWKVALYAMVGELLVTGLPPLRGMHLMSSAPIEGVTGMTFWLTGVACFALSIGILSAVQRTLQSRTLNGFGVYRILAGVGAWVWLYFKG